MEDTLKWMIESRMFDYGDETQWRERAHLRPLPPPVGPEDVLGGADGISNSMGTGDAPGVTMIADARKRGASSVGPPFSAVSEVINLMSDSDDD